MNVLLTGAYGQCGTAILDSLADTPEYDFTCLNRSDRPDGHPYGHFDTVVADVANYEAIRPAFDGQDVVIHLAAYPYVESEWSDVHQPNVVGMENVLRAASEAEVESFVFGSTNHVVGMYEIANRPWIYEPDHGLTIDKHSPRRPDSFYGASKSFGEDLGCYYVENHAYPERFYALRICSVRWPEYDHPYGDAEAGVERGDWERGSDRYETQVDRMKGMWHSRRDFAHMVECCLRDETVDFDVFYGVSDNDRRWFDIDDAKDALGYCPQDNGEEWDEPPS